MFGLFGAAGFGSLAACGLLTNLGVVGRGLVRAARTAADGSLGEAAVQALGAVTAPVLMAAASVTALVGDVLEAANEWTRKARRGADAESFDADAA
jgi:hypothetical protein